MLKVKELLCPLGELQLVFKEEAERPKR